jgi:hypothetical protein
MSLCAFHIAQCALWTLPCALGTVAHGAPPGHATNCLLYTLHTAAPTPHIRQCCPDGGAVHCSLWTTLALHCVLSTWRTALCGRCPAHGARAMSRPLTGGRPVAREKHMWTRHEMAGRQYASSGPPRPIAQTMGLRIINMRPDNQCSSPASGPSSGQPSVEAHNCTALEGRPTAVDKAHLFERKRAGKHLSTKKPWSTAMDAERSVTCGEAGH